MDLGGFLLMRQELILLAVLLLLVIMEIFMSNKQTLVNVGIGLFGLHTVIGFMHLDDGSLFGGMFHTTQLIHLFKNVLNVGVLIILLQSSGWIKEVLVKEHKSTEFFMMMFSSLLGMYFMISSGDFLMFYLGLELSALPIAALVAFETNKRVSAEAGIKFILSSALASGTSVFGVSLIYATTGSIYFAEIVSLLTYSNLSLLGFIFFFSGLAFKISLVPFHFWTADVYQGAPIGVTSYLSVISKGSAVLILMIIVFTVMKPFDIISTNLLYMVSIATMFIGNLFALRQQNMKRFLAFSSIAQAGFILLGMLSNDQLGVSTVVYFVSIYVFTNLAAFGVIQAISSQTGKENMSDYEGLYRTNPKLSLVMMLALFSLAGIPPVAGFFGKFFLFTAAASQGMYLLVFIAVVNVTISLYYYLLVVRAIFLRKSDTPIPYFKSSVSMKLGILIAVVGVLFIGVYSPVYDYIYQLSIF
ncbi:NADH-quinone oxidoreductase subunit N [Lutimonas saemankumensis]|uniref:NADH-quinone oxidoreductase subunit N n=1 Tax=Lutimonas saemankumensis TaxID=483016 RepID=UPI001CD2E68E|nr:NADH-quinone oxidoreductase subunit N [Lutimonas saemankumensis]MCA0930842.1 NADH-quinone oxidoreductase subunit N [Lutimonas saemankumensis]